MKTDRPGERTSERRRRGRSGVTRLRPTPPRLSAERFEHLLLPPWPRGRHGQGTQRCFETQVRRGTLRIEVRRGLAPHSRQEPRDVFALWMFGNGQGLGPFLRLRSSREAQGERHRTWVSGDGMGASREGARVGLSLLITEPLRSSRTSPCSEGPGVRRSPAVVGDRFFGSLAPSAMKGGQRCARGYRAGPSSAGGAGGSGSSAVTAPARRRGTARARRSRASAKGPNERRSRASETSAHRRRKSAKTGPPLSPRRSAY